MKFFEAVPGELFSPLASPNRALYADALDVLYTAYRENLKIREDTLYSMLRSRLEQQLADATFEGEDIDEDELRDISGRARFLIRKLCGKGWFEKERGDDFEEYITVPSYSSRLLELPGESWAPALPRCRSGLPAGPRCGGGSAPPDSPSSLCHPSEPGAVIAVPVYQFRPHGRRAHP